MAEAMKDQVLFTGRGPATGKPARTALRWRHRARHQGTLCFTITPHVPFYFRSEVQMVSDEGLNVYGAVTWGQFFVYQGFNPHCGWMHTSSNADVGDLYAEKMVKKDGAWFYEYNGTLKQVTTRKLVLNIKKGDGVEQKII